MARIWAAWAEDPDCSTAGSGVRSRGLAPGRALAAGRGTAGGAGRPPGTRLQPLLDRCFRWSCPRAAATVVGVQPDLRLAQQPQRMQPCERDPERPRQADPGSVGASGLDRVGCGPVESRRDGPWRELPGDRKAEQASPLPQVVFGHHRIGITLGLRCVSPPRRSWA